MARVIQTMIGKMASDVRVVLQEDEESGGEEMGEMIQAKTTMAEVQAEVKQVYAVLVLLTSGLFECAPAMLRLVAAMESMKKIIPIIIDTADPDHAFQFPTDEWYLQQLPALYARDAVFYKEHNIPLDNLAETIRAMLMKLAVRFTENESGHAQRASIRTVVDRYLSTRHKAASATVEEQTTAGVLISRRHDAASNNQVMPLNTANGE
jgi:hypothetical protein